MRTISSKDNRIVKLCAGLSQKKNRDKQGLYLIEGENLLEEAVKNNAEIQTVLVRKGYEKTLWGLEDRAFMLEDKVFRSLAQTQSSQGVIAIVKKPRTDISQFKIGNEGGNYVVLDRLQDPGNIGTILRTADAAGYKLVIVMEGTADVFSPKVVRAATGSLFRMPVVFMASEDELTEFVRAAGKKLVATCFDTDRYYYEEELRSNIALIIGNEGNGISETLINRSDVKIKIPMENTESLNASVAAGILMYEAVRR